MNRGAGRCKLKLYGLNMFDGAGRLQLTESVGVLPASVTAGHWLHRWIVALGSGRLGIWRVTGSLYSPAAVLIAESSTLGPWRS